MRLFWRLVTAYFILSVVVLSLAGFLIFRGLDTYVTSYFDRTFREDRERIRDWVRDNPGLDAPTVLAALRSLSRHELEPIPLEDSGNLSDWLVVEAPSRVTGQTIDRETLETWLQEGSLVPFPWIQSTLRVLSDTDHLVDGGEIGSADVRRRVFQSDPGGTRLAFRMVPARSDRDELIRLLRLRLIQVGVGAILLVTVLSWFFSRRMVQPINTLVEGARALASGDFEYRLPEGHYGDAETLKKDFDAMSLSLRLSFDRLKRERARLRDLVQDMAHQVKTPISTISLYNQLLLEGKHDQSSAEDFLVEIDEQVQVLTKRVEALVDLSRMESDSDYLRLQEEDVRVTVRRAAAGQRASAEKKGITFTERYPDSPCILSHDLTRFAEAVENVLENAVKFTEPGGRVQVSVKESGRVTVTDTGMGIRASEIPRIFDRFYQGESAPASANGSWGLGLAITRSIVEAHGGRVWATSSEGGGTSVTLELNPEGSDQELE